MQLDFIGQPTLEEPDQIQYELWNGEKPNKIRNTVDYSAVDKLFNSFDIVL